MSSTDLENIAKALVADGKGILAADETPETITKRFDALKIKSTPESRRSFRELLFTTPGVSESISGVIMQDETIHQMSSSGKPFAAVLEQHCMIPGIKVDTGAKPLAGRARETVTEGLDGLRDRLTEYMKIGARFAKWRGVILIAEGLPSSTCIGVNAHALARYAALCQEAGLVPIVEPEVLMDGAHTMERCEEVTGAVLHETMDALLNQGVNLEGMLLKPNMVVPAKQAQRQASASEVAQATLRCLRRHASAAIPGIVFLSGGQTHLKATAHLNAINQLDWPKPWRLSFSFGRALQDEALQTWKGKNENIPPAQTAFSRRSRCVRAAALGNYTDAMEGELAA
jgi:fructose-bisphosphate aldolase class I